MQLAGGVEDPEPRWLRAIFGSVRSGEREFEIDGCDDEDIGPLGGFAGSKRHYCTLEPPDASRDSGNDL